MQKKCHGCGVISDVEDKPFAACPECGLPFGAKPPAPPTARPAPQQTQQERIAQTLRHIDQRPPLPTAPKWFAPPVLNALFWVYAILLGLGGLIPMIMKPSMATAAGLILSLLLIISARIAIEVALAFFHIADCTDDTARSLRIRIREDARRTAQDTTP